MGCHEHDENAIRKSGYDLAIDRCYSYITRTYGRKMAKDIRCYLRGAAIDLGYDVKKEK